MRSLADARDVDEVKRRLRALQPGDARAWGRMTLEEMLCHVRGAFLAAMGELPREASASRPNRLFKFGALWLPMRWPRGVKTVPELERGAPAMRAATFDQERDGVLRELARFCCPEQRRGDHAIFGAMSYGDWMRWGYLHTDHHLRQFGR